MTKARDLARALNLSVSNLVAKGQALKAHAQPQLAALTETITKSWPQRFGVWWRSRSLAQQFAAAAAAVLLLGMAVLGFWVSDRIKQGVMQNSAASGALFMDSYIAPLVQELATGQEISPAKRAELDSILKHAVLDKRVSAIKIWRADGVIAYSNWHDKIGLRFKPTPNFLRALGGTISAEFEGQYHEQDSHERSLAAPLLEIYAPVRDKETGRIIAISEFYESGASLKAELDNAEALSWLVVGLVTAGMMAALSGIVARGSRTIEEQRDRLTAQVDELTTLLTENHELSTKVQRAYGRTAIINEKLLRRVGADLHDGPAQLLSLALLRLDALSPLVESKSDSSHCPTAAASDDLEKIRHSLKEAMKELREISSGLALPELENATLAEVILMAVRAHERRTETRVAVDIGPMPKSVSHELKTCVYRFVQEGLNNAFRHAGGAGQKATARAEGFGIEIDIRDSGPGLGGVDPPSHGLGLSGLRDRIESLGGVMELGDAPGGGARIAARFDVRKLKLKEAQHG